MKKTLLRAGVALTAAGALGIGMAGTATADDDKDKDKDKPITATPSAEDGWKVNGGDGSSVDRISASRISLTDAEGTKSPVYCIDIHTKLDVTHQYQNGSWEDSGVKNLPKVQWVLNNSHPTVDAASVAKEAGADVQGLDAEKVAYTGTQVAIWGLTDKFVLDTEDATEANPKVDKAVAAIYNYLLDNAKEMPEPVNEITIDGPESFDSSERGGPFSLTTPGGPAKLEVEGAKAVNENDEELTEVKSGQEFYLTPDDGTEKITLKATSATQTPSGAVFLSNGQPAEGASALDNQESQRLILAQSLPGAISKNWEFSLEGSDTLPVTGMSLTNSLLTGAGLLLVGALAVVLVRRRRVAASWGDA